MGDSYTLPSVCSATKFDEDIQKAMQKIHHTVQQLWLNPAVPCADPAEFEMFFECMYGALSLCVPTTHEDKAKTLYRQALLALANPGGAAGGAYRKPSMLSITTAFKDVMRALIVQGGASSAVHALVTTRLGQAVADERPKQLHATLKPHISLILSCGEQTPKDAQGYLLTALTPGAALTAAWGKAQAKAYETRLKDNVAMELAKLLTAAQAKNAPQSDTDALFDRTVEIAEAAYTGTMAQGGFTSTVSTSAGVDLKKAQLTADEAAAAVSTKAGREMVTQALAAQGLQVTSTNQQPQQQLQMSQRSGPGRSGGWGAQGPAQSGAGSTAQYGSQGRSFAATGWGQGWGYEEPQQPAGWQLQQQMQRMSHQEHEDYERYQYEYGPGGSYGHSYAANPVPQSYEPAQDLPPGFVMDPRHCYTMTTPLHLKCMRVHHPGAPCHGRYPQQQGAPSSPPFQGRGMGMGGGPHAAAPAGRGMSIGGRGMGPASPGRGMGGGRGPPGPGRGPGGPGFGGSPGMSNANLLAAPAPTPAPVPTRAPVLDSSEANVTDAPNATALPHTSAVDAWHSTLGTTADDTAFFDDLYRPSMMALASSAPIAPIIDLSDPFFDVLDSMRPRDGEISTGGYGGASSSNATILPLSHVSLTPAQAKEQPKPATPADRAGQASGVGVTGLSIGSSLMVKAMRSIASSLGTAAHQITAAVEELSASAAAQPSMTAMFRVRPSQEHVFTLANVSLQTGFAVYNAAGRPVLPTSSLRGGVVPDGGSVATLISAALVRELGLTPFPFLTAYQQSGGAIAHHSMAVRVTFVLGYGSDTPVEIFDVVCAVVEGADYGVLLGNDCIDPIDAYVRKGELVYHSNGTQASLPLRRHVRASSNYVGPDTVLPSYTTVWAGATSSEGAGSAAAPSPAPQRDSSRGEGASSDRSSTSGWPCAAAGDPSAGGMSAAVSVSAATATGGPNLYSRAVASGGGGSLLLPRPSHIQRSRVRKARKAAPLMCIGNPRRDRGAVCKVRPIPCRYKRPVRVKLPRPADLGADKCVQRVPEVFIISGPLSAQVPSMHISVPQLQLPTLRALSQREHAQRAAAAVVVQGTADRQQAERYRTAKHDKPPLPAPFKFPGFSVICELVTQVTLMVTFAMIGCAAVGTTAGLYVMAWLRAASCVPWRTWALMLISLLLLSSFRAPPSRAPPITIRGLTRSLLPSELAEMSHLLKLPDEPGCMPSWANYSRTLTDADMAALSGPLYFEHASQFKLGNVTNQHPEAQKHLLALLDKYRDSAFAWTVKDLPGYKGSMPPMRLPLTTDAKLIQPVRRNFSEAEKVFVRDQVQKLLEMGVVEKVGPHQRVDHISNVSVPAKKDADGKWTDMRMCVDLRLINEHSKSDHYSLHNTSDLHQRLGNACWYSKIDARQSFLQTHLEESDQLKTCFRVDNQLYYYKRVCFGLKNAPAYFQRMMDHELTAAGLSDKVCVFIDDLAIATETLEEHLEVLEKVLAMLANIGLRAHPEKSLFCVPSMEFLGHMVSRHGIQPMEAKVAAIRDMKPPSSVPEARSVMGLFGYYRSFVPDFSRIAKPITQLFCKGVKWEWGQPQQAAFDQLKDCLCTPGLVLRPFNPQLPCLLYSDWSVLGCGCVLCQPDQQGREYMVACASRSNNPAEAKYHAYQGECMCACWAARLMRPFLHCTKWTLITDQRAMQWLCANPHTVAQIERFRCIMMELDCVIQHRAGVKNQQADALSRLPLPSTEDTTGTRAERDPDMFLTPSAAIVASPAYLAHFELITPKPNALAYMPACASFCAPRYDEDLAEVMTGFMDLPSDLRPVELGGGLSAAALPAASSELNTEPLSWSGAYPLSCNTTAVLAEASEIADAAAAGPHADIWQDNSTLQYIRTKTLPVDDSEAEQRRAQRRGANYLAVGDKLIRRFHDGTCVEVPPPAARDRLIVQCHESTGHFGVNRTAALLRQRYWWAGLHLDCRRVVKQCAACDRINAAIGASTPTLHSLPIKGIGYRWGVDLFCPNQETARKHKYVMICVEHFTKHVVAIPLPDKESATTAFAFNHHVIARFGCPAEVVTDNGGEFQGSFQALCEQCFIDHRLTSPMHPQADGLAERCVQTFKGALKKYCHEAVDKGKWDEALPMIAMGYNSSPQASSGYSPFELLYASPPLLPSAIREHLAEPLNFDDPAAAADRVYDNTAWVAKHMPIAAKNLEIAQHRDQGRWALKMSGAYLPRAREFNVGDYVYYQREPDHALDAAVHRQIYRLVEVRETGAAVLMGRCGRTITANVSTLAPCRMLIDGTVDHTLARPPADHPCHVCKKADDWKHMLICDGCGLGYHTYCLTPALEEVPAEELWVCDTCSKAGTTAAVVASRRKHMQQILAQRPPAEVLPGISAPDKLDTEARRQQLHGRYVIRPADSQHPAATWGVVKYIGQQGRAHHFELHFSDGSVLHNLNLTQLQKLKWLQPSGTLWPAGVVSASFAAMPAVVAQAVQPYDLSDELGWHRALKQYMPGPWQLHEARLMRASWRDPAPPGAATKQIVPAHHLQLLLDAIQYPNERELGAGGWFDKGVWNPFAGSCGLGMGVLGGSSSQLDVFCTDIRSAQDSAAHYAHPLHPLSMDTVLHRTGISTIVTAPPEGILDLFMPVAALSGALVAAYVSVFYFTAAPEPRHSWFQVMRNTGRLQLVYTEDREHLWLVIYPTTEPAADSTTRAAEPAAARAQASPAP